MLTEELEDDEDEEEEEEEDDEGVEEEGNEPVDEESTDSMVSASQLPNFSISRKTEIDGRSPFLVKRMSNGSGALFYQARTSPPPAPGPPTAHNPDGLPMGRSRLQRLIISLLTLPFHSIVLFLLTALLCFLLCTSLYLVFRLDSIQQKVETFLPTYPSNFEQISNWQKILHTQSSKKVQEYLDSNLEQISKVIYCHICKRLN